MSIIVLSIIVIRYTYLYFGMLPFRETILWTQKFSQRLHCGGFSASDDHIKIYAAWTSKVAKWRVRCFFQTWRFLHSTKMILTSTCFGWFWCVSNYLVGQFKKKHFFTTLLKKSWCQKLSKLSFDEIVHGVVYAFQPPHRLLMYPLYKVRVSVDTNLLTFFSGFTLAC